MSKTHPLTPYPPDSGSYGTGALNWLGLFCGSEYDWIRESQINWFLQESDMWSSLQHLRSADVPSVSVNRSHRMNLYSRWDQGSRFYLETIGNGPDHSGYPSTCQTERSYVLPYATVYVLPPRVYVVLTSETMLL